LDPFVSIIIPCFNEEKFMPGLLEDLIHQDYPHQLMEVMVIDGASEDQTRKIVLGYAIKYPFLRLIDNDKRFVPFALNLGIRESKGEVIIRMDSHAGYPANYVSLLVKHLYELNADNVGGIWDTVPGNDTNTALAVSRVLSSPFGIGNALYRLKVKNARVVDTVPFGCYRREVFDKIGYFDEDLLRNQDDEFNARLKRNGGIIFLMPDVKITYYARTSLKSLGKMFFQYGLFKPLVNRKLDKPVTMRQFIPPLFVFFLVAFLIAGIFSSLFLNVWLAGITLYIITDLLFTVKIMAETRNLLLIFYLPWIFVLVHISYGCGYLAGVWKFLIAGNKKYQPSSTR
jgi:glycosyltransferase involved in cell wall biosynthesis